MKTLTTLTAIATLLAVNVFAQTGFAEQELIFTISSNSILQPVSMTMEFNNIGIADLDDRDTTNVVRSNPNPAGSNTSADSLIEQSNSISLFTISEDGIFIDKFDSRLVLDRSTVFSFGIESNVSDTITITASTFMGSNTCSAPYNEQINYVYLKDLTTGIAYQILNNNVTLVIPENFDYTMNYQLIVITKPTITTTPVTCFGDSDGGIEIHNPYCTNWNYFIYCEDGDLKSTSFVASDDTTLNVLMESESYTVKIYIDGLLADSEIVLVDSPAEILPSFTLDNFSVFANDELYFTNTSTGADSYDWSFGDSNTDNVTNPTHTFLSAGDYAVTLTATNSNGCSSSFTDTVFVTSPPTYHGPNFSLVSDPTTDPNYSATKLNGSSINVNIIGEQQKITVNQNGEGQVLLVQIINVNGQLINSTSTSSQTVTFDFMTAGIYFVNITTSNGIVFSQKVLVSK
ncbi:MAG: PKD domain-containing protein [Bacteroidetes bacterium]|nr:PKD domain-containing protein [Bacteroidota bacterium]